MFFNQIVGQHQNKEKMRHMLQDGRVAHALMFTGPEGSGNLPAAFAFVQYLFCQNKNNGDSCGICSSCLKVSKLIHPDLHLVFPIATSKMVKTSDHLLVDFREAFLAQPYLSLNEWFNYFDAENKQPIIPKDESDNILKKLSYTSYEGSYKVMIIWQPEKMNATSANKLLKILEEPPEQTLFILVCHHPDQLLATIISRVQQLIFNKPTTDEIKEALIKNHACSEQIARQAALLSDGNYREAELLIDEQENPTAFFEKFRDFMRIAVRFDAPKAVVWIEENSRVGREKQKQFIQYGLEIMRDCLMYSSDTMNLIKHSGDEIDFISKFSSYVHRRNYIKIIEELNSSYYHIERNANPKILFMDLMFKMNEYLNIPKG
jgi:DNA polymerase III subunit delta'